MASSSDLHSYIDRVVNTFYDRSTLPPFVDKALFYMAMAIVLEEGLRDRKAEDHSNRTIVLWPDFLLPFAGGSFNCGSYEVLNYINRESEFVIEVPKHIWELL